MIRTAYHVSAAVMLIGIAGAIGWIASGYACFLNSMLIAGDLCFLLLQSLVLTVAGGLCLVLLWLRGLDRSFFK